MAQDTTMDVRTPEEEKMTFSRLARNLAQDYESIYYINMENSHYKEYAADGDNDGVRVLSCGDDFFSDTIANCEKAVYHEDQERLISMINRETFEKAIKNDIAFTFSYRLVKDGKPVHYKLKAIHGKGPDEQYMIIGTRNVEREVVHEMELPAEGEIYAQIAHAMLSRYEVIYYVDIVTDRYIEYSTSKKYGNLNIGSTASDNFFEDAMKNIPLNIYHEDVPLLQNEMQKGKLLFELGKDSVYSLNYRLILNGSPEYVNMRVVRPKNDERHIIIGVTNINAAVIREKEFKEAMVLATKDPLTGVKNKRAYLDSEQKLNQSIEKKEPVDFAIVVCDINDLKTINDTKGHLAGDTYIKDACALICNTFKHSPVYRVGGDEFCVLLRGDDFDNYVELFEKLRTQILTNRDEGGLVIASGLAVFDAEIDYAVSDVFKRADTIMYKNKKSLKSH